MISNTTEEITLFGLTFTVNYDYFPFCPGSRESGTGFQLEPDEPESVEICEIFTEEDILEVFDRFPSREDLTSGLAATILEKSRERDEE
jgi:hypothetical protein